MTQPIGVGNAPGSLAVSADAVWVVNTLDDTVSRINPDTNSVVDTIQVGDGPSGIAVVEGTVWVANEADGTLSRIEPGQTSASPTVIGSVPQGLAGVNGDLWVSVRGTATSHRGGTLRLVSLGPPVSLDPGVAYDASRHGACCTCSGTVWSRSSRSVGATPRLVPTWPPPYRRRPTAVERTPSSCARGSDTRTVRSSRPPTSAAPSNGVSALNTERHGDLYGGLVGGEACASEPRNVRPLRGHRDR